jgi:SAM-dependent methyltransferase
VNLYREVQEHRIDEFAKGPESGDAFGIALLDCFTGKNVPEIIERDDGLILLNKMSIYLDPPGAWSDLGRRAVAHARGRILDVGCGAGRHALFLQEKGFEVTGLDTSPGALEVAQKRGLRSTFLGTLEEHALTRLVYDTFLLLGGNLCLLGSPGYAPVMLQQLRGIAAPGARIIGQTIDPSLLTSPLYTEYYQRNQSRGRWPGLMRYRIRYQRLAGPWFEYLYCTPSDLEHLATGTGWEVSSIEREEGNAFYTAILQLIS